MKKHYFILPFFFLLEGCIVFHSGGVSGGPLLSSKSKFIKFARGEARHLFVLGVGNININELINDAKKDMYMNNPLETDQYYSNFTTDITSKYIFLFIQLTQVRVSADIMTTDTSQKSLYDRTIDSKQKEDEVSKRKEQAAKNNLTQSLAYLINDTVYYSPDGKNYFEYFVRSIDAENTLLYGTKPETKNRLASKFAPIFIKNFKTGGLKNGDEVNYEFVNAFKAAETSSGTVLGFCNNMVLIKSKDSFAVEPVSKVKKK